jgi:hypothetical protein
MKPNGGLLIGVVQKFRLSGGFLLELARLP